jgi:hypothetical protein
MLEGGDDVVVPGFFVVDVDEVVCYAADHEEEDNRFGGEGRLENGSIWRAMAMLHVGLNRCG